MKSTYDEGSVFLIPLRDGGVARGVVARTAPKGRVLLGYFFGPRLEREVSATLDDLSPDRALASIRFGDLRLIKRQWKVIGSVPNWHRAEWPMPNFVRRDPISGKAWLVRYSDVDPLHSVSEPLSNYDDFGGLASDGLYGAEAAERWISKLLSV
jgi:hypothetical protein